MMTTSCVVPTSEMASDLLVMAPARFLHPVHGAAWTSKNTRGNSMVEW